MGHEESQMRSTVDTLKVLELNRRFHDEVEAQSYDARMGVRHDPISVKRMMDELESVRGAALRGGHVVDVGAGTGNVAIKLALSGRFSKVSAVDISRVSLETLLVTARDLECEVETIESDMRHLPLVDRILLNRVLPTGARVTFKFSGVRGYR